MFTVKEGTQQERSHNIRRHKHELSYNLHKTTTFQSAVVVENAQMAARKIQL